MSKKRSSLQEAQDLNTPPERLSLLASHEDPMVPQYMSQNIEVRVFIAMNPKAPAALLAILLQDKDERVRKAAKR